MVNNAPGCIRTQQLHMYVEMVANKHYICNISLFIYLCKSTTVTFIYSLILQV